MWQKQKGDTVVALYSPRSQHSVLGAFWIPTHYLGKIKPITNNNYIGEQH